jgi:hypothetical protein
VIASVRPVSLQRTVLKVQPVSKVPAVVGRSAVQALTKKSDQSFLTSKNTVGRHLDVLI